MNFLSAPEEKLLRGRGFCLPKKKNADKTETVRRLAQTQSQKKGGGAFEESTRGSASTVREAEVGRPKLPKYLETPNDGAENPKIRAKNWVISYSVCSASLLATLLPNVCQCEEI